LGRLGWGKIKTMTKKTKKKGSKSCSKVKSYETKKGKKVSSYAHKKGKKK